MTRYRARRLVDGPIVAPGMDARMGDNVQGPSLIRVPDWAPGSLGRYYLYFADHKGSYIRLAYADALAGPWRIHGPGALQLAQSGFPCAPLQPPPEAAAKVARPAPLAGIAPPGTPGVPDRMLDATYPHIASPDVHVDQATRRIVMYYHGLERFGAQRTRAATSADGLVFEAPTPVLGPPYFRVFRHDGSVYALTMPGVLYRAPGPFGPFERGPTLFGPDQRHTAVMRRGRTLHVFWTRVGDAPERIYASAVDLAGDWTDWRAGDPTEVLRPERPWEGADLPVEPSWRSAIGRPVNQLRDPCVFEDDGGAYLLYALRGEQGIGIAELEVAD